MNEPMPSIITNNLKKGDLVKLNNGWYAVIADNPKGNARMAEVHGHYTETGSVYSHDIAEKLVKVDPSTLAGGEKIMLVATPTGPLDKGVYLRYPVEHTPAQKKLRRQLEGRGW